MMAAITSIALVGGVILVRSEHKNRQLAKRAAAYRVHSEEGDPKSQFRLGTMYYYGTGVPKDYVEAVRWYRKSAEQGNANAQYMLAYMYHEGRGIARDDSEAARWDRKGAEQGDPTCQDTLAFMYLRGEGVKQDYAEAARWYRKAAEQGNADAQYTLGYMYYSGYGVSQDRVEANRLFHEAAVQGNEDAKRSLGLSRSHPAISKIKLPLDVLASLFFGLASFKLGKSLRPRSYIAAILLACSFVMDLFWYSYIGHLQSPTSFTALYLARHFVGGLICALLLSILFPNSAKVVLILATALFINFVVFRVVVCDLRHTPVTLRLLCFAGLPLGMAMTSSIILWLDHRKRGEMPNDEATLPLALK
jgi:hypothetical protein